MLLQFLAREAAACPVCGYGLAGLRSDRCPECAAPLSLAVASARSSSPAWVVAVCSVSLGLGFDGVVSVLLLIAATVSFVMQGPPPGIPWQAVLVGGTFPALTCAGLGAITGLVRVRRRWRMAPARRQWVWAAGVFALTGAVHAAVGITLATVL